MLHLNPTHGKEVVAGIKRPGFELSALWAIEPRQAQVEEFRKTDTEDFE
jgi:hypothetical protein